jgi:hypothetical protein
MGSRKKPKVPTMDSIDSQRTGVRVTPRVPGSHPLHQLYPNLSGAILSEADLSGVNLSGANLSGASLQGAQLSETDFSGADLTGCRVYGVSAWNLKLVGAKQQNLVITREDDPEITVDNVEVAQFIHLMLHNEKIRDVIDTITSKVVLILGASPLSVRQSSMLYVRNCASATTYRCPHGPLHHCRPD